MSDYILKDYDGNIFISLTSEDEAALSKHRNLTHCLAVVKLGEDYLFGFNRWRSRWEVFGGCIDEGETPGDCIIRECHEELGIDNTDFEYLGTMKFLMMPDYFSSEQRIEYGGLYGITLKETSVQDIYSQIEDRNEIVKLALYKDIKGIEPVSPIDEKLIEYYP